MAAQLRQTSLRQTRRGLTNSQAQRATEIGVTLRQIYYRHEGHTLLKAQFGKVLSRRRKGVKRGIVTEVQGLPLLGGPGSGKSRSIEELFKRHQDLVLPAPDQERADVISFRVPSPATLKDVGMTALEALGYPPSSDRPAGIVWGKRAPGAARKRDRSTYMAAFARANCSVISSRRQWRGASKKVWSVASAWQFMPA